MSTNILALPELSIPCAIESNQDWLDSIVFFDSKGAGVPLDGIDFRLQVRVSAELPDVLVDASTDNGLLQVLSSGFQVSVASPGAGGYAVGDIIYLAGGNPIVPAALQVTSVTLLGINFFFSNPGWTAGAVVPLTGGTSKTPASIVIDTVDANGDILTYHIQNGGQYSQVPVTLLTSQPPINGNAYTLFTKLVWGVKTIALSNPGAYNALPASPAAQDTTTGVGSGATFVLTQTNNALAILIPADKLVHPLIEAAGIYQIQAMADGYVQNLASGPMTVTQGIVR